MGALLDAAAMLGSIVTRRVASQLFDWMQLISGNVETNTTNIATLTTDSIAQSKYAELAADTNFTAGQTIVTTTITTTTVNGILDINWGGSCKGDTASTFYTFWLKVDGVVVQSSRFTLDGASATFAFPFGSTKRLTGVAPGAHVVSVTAQPGGGAQAQFFITTNADNCALLVREIRP
jgi:hypothetical protein